jgi:hypothetical protein
MAGEHSPSAGGLPAKKTGGSKVHATLSVAAESEID